MPSSGLEAAIPATKRPQTYVLDRMATGKVADVSVLYYETLISKKAMNLQFWMLEFTVSGSQFASHILDAI
jgi:hypothetical protein